MPEEVGSVSAHHQHLVVPNARKNRFIVGVPVNILIPKYQRISSRRSSILTPTTDVWPRKTFVGSIEVFDFVYELTSLPFLRQSSLRPRESLRLTSGRQSCLPMRRVHGLPSQDSMPTRTFIALSFTRAAENRATDLPLP